MIVFSCPKTKNEYYFANEVLRMLLIKKGILEQ